MKNIRKPVYRYLFNSLNTFDNRDNHSIGLYNDHKQGRKILCLNGFQIPGDTVGSDATTDDPTATGTKSTSLELSKSETDDGVFKGVLLKLDNTAPHELYDWKYALTILEKVKNPNVHTNRNNKQQKTYSGVLRKIEATGAIINDEYIRAAEDDIITQITNDTGLHINNSDPISRMSGSVVNAYRYFKVTLGTFANNEIRITTYTKTKGDGTTWSDIVCLTSAMASADVINGTSSLKDLVRAFAVNTTDIIIVSKVPGQLFDVEDGEDTDAITVAERGIMLLAKNVNVQFEAKYEINSWTATPFQYMEITDATTTNNNTFTYIINGVVDSQTVAENGTLATHAAAINTATGVTTVYASYDSYINRVIVWGNSTIDNMIFTTGATGTATTYYHAGYNARYPSLTSEDVFRVFWNQRDQGSLSAMGYLDQPEANTDYVKYTIKSLNIPVSDVIGAGYNTTTEVELELYVKKSIIATNYWQLANGDPQCYMKAASSADKSLEGILTIFAGVAPSSW